ncbi:hypothetical protein HK100_002092 [Physocladia obscura]|uniref:Thioesterase domain-containing protein n=1 Tax=Physocladia obscura TaxID=109957 RepID=A0AAD5XEF0_9FUNG|nr:hypothetical protein HK100_002092 [Physocladia obscura]
MSSKSATLENSQHVPLPIAKQILAEYHKRLRNEYPGILSGMKVVDIDPTNRTTTFELQITQTLLNEFGSLHGGAVCGIIDECTSAVLMAIDKLSFNSLSLDMSVSFVSGAAKKDDVLVIVGKSTNVSKKFAFAEAAIFKKEADGSKGRLLAFGKQTKFRFGSGENAKL